MLRGLPCATPALLDAEAAGDGEEPRRQRRAPAELVQAARRGEQRVLHDVLCVLGIAAHLRAEAIDGGRVALEQQRHCLIVTRAKGVQQLLVCRGTTHPPEGM